MAVSERVLQVLGGVDNVGCQHDVELVERKALLLHVVLHVEQPEVHHLLGRELGLDRVPQEVLGDVREHVLDVVLAQERHEVAGGAACAQADLQDAHHVVAALEVRHVRVHCPRDRLRAAAKGVGTAPS